MTAAPRPSEGKYEDMAALAEAAGYPRGLMYRVLGRMGALYMVRGNLVRGGFTLRPEHCRPEDWVELDLVMMPYVLEAAEWALLHPDGGLRKAEEP